MWVSGDGSVKFYESTASGYVSPAGDLGTLATSGSGFQYTASDQTEYDFSLAAGYTNQYNLTEIASANGQTNLYQYAGSELTLVKSADGSTATFAYTSSSVTIDDPSGSVVLALDANNNLTQLTDEAGDVYTFSYDGNHRLTATSDPSTFSYDSYGFANEMNVGLSATYDVTPQIEQGLQTSSLVSVSPEGASVSNGSGTAFYGFDQNGQETRRSVRTTARSCGATMPTTSRRWPRMPMG